MPISTTSSMVGGNILTGGLLAWRVTYLIFRPGHGLDLDMGRDRDMMDCTHASVDELLRTLHILQLYIVLQDAVE